MATAAEGTERELVSTRQYVGQVIAAFESLIQAVDSADKGIHAQLSAQSVADELAYFRVWAGTTGAHRTGRTSLDHKLRLASHIHGKVTTGLQGLQEALVEGAVFL